MRTDTPQPIRLSDYRPPAFLVDEAQIAFDLQPNATRVKARLAVRRNGAHAAPLRFNGERLKLVSVAVDGRPLAEGEHSVDDEFLTIPGVGDAFVTGLRDGTGGEEVVGYVFLSTDVAPEIVGYSGKPIVTLVGMDAQGRISGARIRRFVQ